MYKCEKCKSEFPFPEVKRPDAGLTKGDGILGYRKMEPVKFCPECFSTKIKKMEVEKAV